MSETAAGVAHVQDVVNEVMVAHAARGAKLQAGLRLGGGLRLGLPAARPALLVRRLVLRRRGSYPVIWAASLVWVGRPRVAGTDPGWFLLVLDIVVLGVLTLIAGLSARTAGPPTSSSTGSSCCPSSPPRSCAPGGSGPRGADRRRLPAVEHHHPGGQRRTVVVPGPAGGRPRGGLRRVCVAVADPAVARHGDRHPGDLGPACSSS